MCGLNISLNEAKGFHYSYVSYECSAVITLIVYSHASQFLSVLVKYVQQCKLNQTMILFLTLLQWLVLLSIT